MKNVKTIMALILVASFVLVLVACGTEPAPTAPSQTPQTSSTLPSAVAPASTPPAGQSSQPPAVVPTDLPTKGYRIGINTFHSTAILMEFGNYAEYTWAALGDHNTSRASDELSADRELQNIQNFLAQGVDGITYMGGAEAVLRRVSDECKSAKVPFVMYNFPPNADDLAYMRADNPYFTGAVTVDWFVDGGIIAQRALDDGHRTAILVGSTYGSTTVDNRSAGFRSVFEAAGGVILDELRGDNVDTQQRVINSLSAHSDVDCVFIMGTDQLEGTMAAYDMPGTPSKPSYLSGINATSKPYYDSGVLIAGTGGSGFFAYIAPPLLLNALDGHPIKDPNGDAPYLLIATSLITAENYIAYFDVFADATAVGYEVVRQLAYRFNPDVTYDLFLEIIDRDFNVDALLARRG